jgi:transposase-like protein
MYLEEVNQLLKPGYLPMETGFCRLPNGQMFVAALTRKHGRSSDWVEWCFGNYFFATTAFNDREVKKIRSGGWNSRWKTKQYIGTSQKGELLMGGNVHKFKMVFNDPAKYFDTYRFKEAKIGAVICGDTFLLDGTPEGCIIHLVRDTAMGCEIKTRAWLYNATEEVARLHMERFISIGDVLDNLDKVMKRNTCSTEDIFNITCKFCHSNLVIKNGIRIDTQYWRCKNCGRSFVNNQALPRMKYPLHIISTAVSDYYAGNSLNHIRKGIEKKTSFLPSTSTVYEWIRKITGSAIDSVKSLQPTIGKVWAIDARQIWLSGRQYWLVNLLDTESRFLLASRLFSSRDLANLESLLNSTCLKLNRFPAEVLISQENLDSKINSWFERHNIFSNSPADSGHLDTLLRGWFETVTDRFKPLRGIDINKGTQILLEGFAFHYNYIRLNEYLGKTPAQASGLDLPFTSWLDLIKE